MSTEIAASDGERLSVDEHRAWASVSEADGWDIISPAGLYDRAVEAVAWELIEQTMDTADREPCAETVREAMLTARRLLGSLRCPPGQRTDGGDR